MNSIEMDVIPGVQSNESSWRDLVGIIASIGCAIHCAAMPFVIAYLPALGLSFLADESFHKWMALICFLIALAAFLPRLRKHGNWLPVGIGSAGLVLITYAAFGLAGECCPSCTAAVASESAFASDSTGGEPECISCEHCSNCQSENETNEVRVSTADDFTSPVEKDLLSSLAPWITPFGGILLVAAHLMNRRFGCLCGCCGPDTETISASKS